MTFACLAAARALVVFAAPMPATDDEAWLNGKRREAEGIKRRRLS